MDNDYLLDLKRVETYIKDCNLQYYIDKFAIPTKHIALFYKMIKCYKKEDIKFYFKHSCILIEETQLHRASRFSINIYRYIFFIPLCFKKEDVFNKILKEESSLDDYINFIDNLPVINKEGYQRICKEFFSVIACSFLDKWNSDKNQEQMKKDKERIITKFNMKIQEVNTFTSAFEDKYYQKSSAICEKISGFYISRNKE